MAARFMVRAGIRLRYPHVISDDGGDRPAHAPLGICEWSNRQGLRSIFPGRRPWHEFDWKCLEGVPRTGIVPFPLPG